MIAPEAAEAGVRKFLIILDDTPEMLNAMRYAAIRAAKTGGGIEMLAVVSPEEFQHFMGVADVMRAEAHEKIEAQEATCLSITASTRAPNGLYWESCSLAATNSRCASRNPRLSGALRIRSIASIIRASRCTRSRNKPKRSSVCSRASRRIEH